MSLEAVTQISVVVPAFNEEVRLKSSLPHLHRALKRRFENFEIIVVDDGSRDGTSALVRQFIEAHPAVRLVVSEKNYGKGHAVRCGVMAARGRYILFSDADLSTPVREVAKLIKLLEEGADVAIGSRAHRDTRILKRQPLYRTLMGKTFNLIVRFLGIGEFRDTQCGFKCFKRHAAREIFFNLYIDGFCLDVELLYVAKRKGFKVREVGVLWRNNAMSKVHPIFSSLQMLRELFLIRLYAFWGYYGPVVSIPEVSSVGGEEADTRIEA